MTKRNPKGPATDPKDVGNALNELLETLRDGEQGFKTAAEAVDDAEIKRLFLSLGGQRAEFASELEAELLRLGHEPAEHGHAAGAMHRGWINLRSAIAGKDEGPIVSEAERGEDFAVKKFRETLQRGLPAEVQTIVERQYIQIQDAHDHVRSLERAFGRS
jgi:uncharacterized protein (TIGR02284 family)